MKLIMYYSLGLILCVLYLISFVNTYSLELEDEIENNLFYSAKNQQNHVRKTKRWAKSNNFFSKWPNSIVNYKISCTEFTPDELILIRSALNEIENRTCVRFVEYAKNDYSVRDYINVQCIPHGHCKAQLGYLGGKQNLNLDRAVKIPKEYCVNYRKIQHEFLHSLGFKHEHSSPNRDNYIEIMWDNVRRGSEAYFKIDRRGMTYHYGCAFDYNSVMSVPSNRQSKNGNPTIVPKDPNYTSDTIGIALSISECDVIRINNMYCSDPLQARNNFRQQYNIPDTTLVVSNQFNQNNGQNNLFETAGEQDSIQHPRRRQFGSRNPNNINSLNNFNTAPNFANNPENLNNPQNRNLNVQHDQNNWNGNQNNFVQGSQRLQRYDRYTL